MKTLAALLLLCLLFFTNACRDTPPDPLSDIKLQHNYQNIQHHLINFLDQGNELGSRFSRMTPLEVTDIEEALEFYNLLPIWNIFHTDIDPVIREVIRSAEIKKSYFISGSSKVMKAFLYFSMIDLFSEGAVGPVYGEQRALNGNTTPPSDLIFPADTNYQRGILLLDHAIAELEKEGELPERDIFYNGDASQWIKLARSLQLRAYNNIRLVEPSAKEKINELLSRDDFIENIEDDFQYTYNFNGPAGGYPSRWFLSTYNITFSTPWAPPYLSNYFMWLLVGEKPVPDPRTRYYFNRQTSDFSMRTGYCFYDTLVPGNLPQAPAHYVEVDPRMPYCIAASNGYLGRDHGINIEYQPDQAARTAIGLYPYGGKFDDNSFDSDIHGDRVFGNGNGRYPILTSSFVSFIRAEAALTLGTDDDPVLMLEKGIRQSFAKVKSFEQFLDQNCPVSSCRVVDSLIAEADQQLDAYVNFVIGQYEATNDPDKKLDIIMKEYLIALWGNGWEAYNNYRRTAMPLNIQPPVDPERLDFLRSAPLFYTDFGVAPEFENAPVFWDTNEASKFR